MAFTPSSLAWYMFISAVLAFTWAVKPSIWALKTSIRFLSMSDLILAASISVAYILISSSTPWIWIR